jgi:hypothetical protein
LVPSPGPATVVAAALSGLNGVWRIAMSIPRFEDLPPGIFTAIDELPAIQFPPGQLPPNPILPPSPVFETNPAVPIIDTLFGDPGDTPAVGLAALNDWHLI